MYVLKYTYNTEEEITKKKKKREREREEAMWVNFLTLIFDLDLEKERKKIMEVTFSEEVSEVKWNENTTLESW